MLQRWSGFLVLAVLAGQAAHAQQFRVPTVDETRKGKWEAAFQVNYLPSQDYTGDKGSTIDVKSRFGWGFDLAYNVSDHLALGFDFSWTRPRYTATLKATDGDPENPQPGDDRVVSNRADLITGQFYGAWNFFKGNFTPFVEAGGGWTYIDSNIVDNEVPPVCWWDPWWGWVCNVTTYSGTEVSYGGGAGFRWQPNETLLLKLSYNIMVLDTDGDKPEIQGVKFEIGSRY